MLSAQYQYTAIGMVFTVFTTLIIFICFSFLIFNAIKEITMDSMNSYERRIVHSALADDKYVYTESIGEEPNRKVVIKLKGE